MTNQPDLDARRNAVLERIHTACKSSGRDSRELTLIAVTKTHPVELIRKACALSYQAVGENRVQEVVDKYSDGWIRRDFPEVRLHLIGHLQTNKVRKAVELVDSIDSVDSLKLAKAISRIAGETDRTVRVLLEVNTSGELQKYGIHPAETIGLAEQIAELPNLRLAGLMTIGPLTNDTVQIRKAFDHLRILFDDVQDRLQSPDWQALSMGMSNDFEIAIAAGTTELRLGSVLFGPRRNA